MWQRTGLALVLLLAVVSQAPAQERKYALVVGVTQYGGDPFENLTTPEKDAHAMEAALNELGFHVVIAMTSQSKLPSRRPTSAKKIHDQLDLLLNKKEADDVVLVLLSGHGIQLKADQPDANGKKETYFCPEDAQPDDKSTLLAIGDVMKKLAACTAKKKLLLVDACREETITKETEKKSRGTIELEPVRIKRLPPPEGLAVLFSCGEGETSFGLAGIQQGVFTHYALKYLKGEADANRYQQGQLTITELASYVSRETHDHVLKNLGKAQTPELVVPGGLRPWSLGKRTIVSAIPVGTKAGEERVFSDLKIKMNWCPPGRFTMGSPKGEKDRDSNEDQVEVTLSRGFWLGQTEVTQGLWESVMGTTPWKGKKYVKEGANYPATYISHGGNKDGSVEGDSALEFCEKLTAREQAAGRMPRGVKYRLPTEAEWEYACRAGAPTPTMYSFGADATKLSDHAWWGGIFGDGNAKAEQYAHEVGTKRANAWRLYDMHGNVYEWCGDWYDEKLARGRDPRGPSEGSHRVFRGGGWFSTARLCRSASRFGGVPSSRNDDLGYRLSLSPSE